VRTKPEDVAARETERGSGGTRSGPARARPRKAPTSGDGNPPPVVGPTRGANPARRGGAGVAPDRWQLATNEKASSGHARTTTRRERRAAQAACGQSVAGSAGEPEPDPGRCASDGRGAVARSSPPRKREDGDEPAGNLVAVSRPPGLGTSRRTVSKRPAGRGGAGSRVHDGGESVVQGGESRSVRTVTRQHAPPASKPQRRKAW
jgi:hypothetical protein